MSSQSPHHGTGSADHAVGEEGPRRRSLVSLLLAVLVRMPQTLLPLGLAAALIPVSNMFTASLAVGAAGLGALLAPRWHHRLLGQMSPRTLLLTVSMFHVLLLVLIASAVHPLAGSLNAGYQSGWSMYLLAFCAGTTLPIPQAVPDQEPPELNGRPVSSSALSVSAIAAAGALTALHSLGSGGIASLITSAIISASAVPLAAMSMRSTVLSLRQRVPVNREKSRPSTGRRPRMTVIDGICLVMIGAGLGGLVAAAAQLGGALTGPGLMGIVVIAAVVGAAAAAADLLQTGAMSWDRQGRLLATMLAAVTVPLLPLTVMLSADVALPVICVGAVVVGFCTAAMAMPYRRPKPQRWADGWKMLALTGGAAGMLAGAWLAEAWERGWPVLVLLAASLTVATLRLVPTPRETSTGHASHA